MEAVPRFVNMVNATLPPSPPELQLDAGDLNILHSPAYTGLWNMASRLSTRRSAMRVREERRGESSLSILDHGPSSCHLQRRTTGSVAVWARLTSIAQIGPGARAVSTAFQTPSETTSGAGVGKTHQGNLGLWLC